MKLPDERIEIVSKDLLKKKILESNLDDDKKLKIISWIENQPDDIKEGYIKLYKKIK